ncbi:MAG: FHA domain-containing protein [Propionibacteriaceae bacterium]|jgi:hypothetical protein|nr:FHA domain-containing protein [Propionibacteriaceae bacterium]
MPELTVVVAKVAFLALVWLFIALIAGTIRTDMVGRAMPAPSGRVPAHRPPSPEASRRQAVPPVTPRPEPEEEPWVLAIDSGSRAGERLQLVDEVHIGRSPQCELMLDDDYISSMHALLRHHPADPSRGVAGHWSLTDLGSTNGTFVNSAKITQPTLVTVDDVMRIGRVQMRLER